MQSYAGDIVEGISTLATPSQNTISPIIFNVLILVGFIIVILVGVLFIFAILGLITSHLYSLHLVKKYGHWNSRYISEHDLSEFEEAEYLLFNNGQRGSDDKRK
jgi:hypothetical protein